MKIILKILFIYFFNFNLYSQIIDYTIDKKETIIINKEVYIANDAFDFKYFITNNSLIKKKNNEYFEYKNVLLGNITKIDIQNPLLILVFYKEFNTCVFLDNQLNETQIINFSENKNQINLDAVGTASQNRIWFVNSITNQICLYDRNSNHTTLKSQPLKSKIKQYGSDYNYFYWIDQSNVFYYLDIYGKVSNLGKVPDFDIISFIEKEKIFFLKDQNLYYYDFNQKNKTLIELDKKRIVDFSYKNQILSIFTDIEIINYIFTLK